jgi:hypothetical protein
MNAHGSISTTQKRTIGFGRQALFGLAVLGAAALPVAAVSSGAAYAPDRFVWDKTFPQNDRAEHSKVTYQNPLSITLVADLYMHKSIGPTINWNALSRRPLRVRSTPDLARFFRPLVIHAPSSLLECDPPLTARSGQTKLSD